MKAELKRLQEWQKTYPRVIPEGEFERGEKARVSALNQQNHHSVGEKIADLDAALGRITAGTFGDCTECKSQISPDRIMAHPEYELCTTCQRKKGLKIH